MVKDILKLKYVLGTKSSLKTIIIMIWHYSQSTPESQDGKGHESDEQCNLLDWFSIEISNLHLLLSAS